MNASQFFQGRMHHGELLASLARLLDEKPLVAVVEHSPLLHRRRALADRDRHPARLLVVATHGSYHVQETSFDVPENAVVMAALVRRTILGDGW